MATGETGASGLVVLGGLKTQSLPSKAAALAIATIFTCYLTSSVLLRHTPLWLPDSDSNFEGLPLSTRLGLTFFFFSLSLSLSLRLSVTHCARGSPERYFFRIGMSCSCCLLIGVWVTVATWADRVCMAHGSSASCCHALPNEKACLCGAVGCLLLIMGSCCIEPGDEMPWTFHTIGASGFFICQVFAMCSVTSNVTRAAREAEKAGVIAPVGLSLSALQIKQACVYAFYFLLGLEILFPLVGWTGWHGALLEWLLTVNVMVWVMSLSLDFKQAQLYAAFVEPQSPSAPTKVAPAHK